MKSTQMAFSKPSVFVLVSTYNGEKYLEEQLKSIEKQEKVYIEMLVRDDGSKDNTRKILEQWNKRGKLKWYTGEHLHVKGSFFDLLFAASKSRHRYFALSDQDDVWDKDKLSIALKALESYPQDIPALYYCGQRLVDKNLRLISNHFLNKDRNLETRFIKNDAAGCTIVFNRCLLDKLNEYEPINGVKHDGWIFKVCYALGGNIWVDDQPHISYRQHENNEVGLRPGLYNGLKEAYIFFFKSNIRLQVAELKNGYSNQISQDRLLLIDSIYNYMNDKKSRKYLLDKNNVDFHKRAIHFIYWIKILLKKI